MPVLVPNLSMLPPQLALCQKRAELKDYLDVDALLQNGVDLPAALAAGSVVYGSAFNPVITLKALSFFVDIPGIPGDVKQRLTSAVAAVDLAKLK